MRLPRLATIHIDPPEGDPVSVEFDLTRLR